MIDFEPWLHTGVGLTRHIEHNCGAGATCLYQVRAINPVGTGPETGIVSGTGLEDLVAPNLLVFTPKSGANVEDYATLNYNGLIGTDFGDAKTISAKVFACNNCTNIAPTQTLAPTIIGRRLVRDQCLHSTAGVYTLQVLQTDWAGHTTEIVRMFQTRPAIFVSPLGNDANPGTAASPKQDDQCRASVRRCPPGAPRWRSVRARTPGLSISAGSGNKTINGGFDQYAGWVRPGSAGVAGTPNQDLSNIEAAGTSTVVAFSNDLGDFNGLKIHGTNQVLPPVARSTGCERLNGADVTFQNVKVLADAGVAGTNGTNGANAADGGSGVAGSLGGEPCTSYIPGTVNGGTGGTGGASNGGKGGNGSCNNNGGAGDAGAGGGGTAGGGGAKSSGAVVSCPDGSPGGGGGAGVGRCSGHDGRHRGYHGHRRYDVDRQQRRQRQRRHRRSGRRRRWWRRRPIQPASVAVAAMTPAAVAAAAGPPALVAPSERAVPPVAVRSACTSMPRPSTSTP